RLKGLDIYPWVFSAYLLASTVTTPLYGKLSDRIGRKRMLLFGLGLFSLGSILSGCAQSMPQLIAMRVVQGLGAGALGPIVVTMIGDLYTLHERGKVQGLFSGVWGAASLLGPALGGELTDQLSWRAVFFVTVPVSLIAAWILFRHVDERIQAARRQPVDWLGSALLAGSSTALLLAVLGEGGRPTLANAWWLGLALVLGAFLWVQEKRAADPVLSLELISRPTVAASIAGSFLIGALLFGVDTYIPLYVQGVLGGSARQAGRMITPLFLAWSISVAVAAKLLVRLGFRRTGVIGSLLTAAGAAAVAVGSLNPAWASLCLPVGMIVIGLGMGPAALCFTVDVQNSVAWAQRGVATSIVMFSRTIGGALGVGILGASLFFALSHRLAAAGATDIDVAAALRPETHAKLSTSQLRLVQRALGGSLGAVFVQMAALAALGTFCSSRLSGGRISKPNEGALEELEKGGVPVVASEL
ncbi:MAG TPA: MFS transporter, partial [Isosphaeraceae bacterium]|nr:MFS transporter [Isosphaeraceae bacterium]